MKNLYTPLPDVVTVRGEQYPITTDFRDWLRFEALIDDAELTEQQKVLVMLQFFTETIPRDISAAVEALADFFRCGDSADNEPEQGKQADKTKGRVCDFSEDAPLIYAAFRQAYNIDLLSLEYLHWWAFRALLDALPENTRFSWVVGIRAADTRGMSKNQSDYYTKMKKLVALSAKDTAPRFETKEDRDKALRDKAIRINQRAQNSTTLEERDKAIRAHAISVNKRAHRQ